MRWNSVTIFVYNIAIIALLVLLSIVIYKLIIAPPCSIVGQHECVIDGWTVAGLAATILGVGATLLAILGAVAVAAWWTNLNNQVDKRVEKRVSKRLDQLMKEQQILLREQTNLLFSKQEEALEKKNTDLQQQIKVMREHATSTENILQDTKRLLTMGVMKQEPWKLENWANEVTLTTIGPEVAFWMARNYLRVANELLSSDTQKALAYQKNLEIVLAPSTLPKYYLDKANEWLRITNATYPQINTITLTNDINTGYLHLDIKYGTENAF